MQKKIIIMTIVGIISCLLLGIGGAVGYAIDDEFGLLIGMAVMCIIISVILRGHKDILIILSSLSTPATYRGILKGSSVKIILPVIILIIGFTYYHQVNSGEIRDLCWKAEKAHSLELRKSLLLQAGEIPNLGSLISLFPWATVSSNPMTKCEWVQDELDKVLTQGKCSKYILKDVPCKCGKKDWLPGAPVCKNLTSTSPMCLVINWQTMEHEITCNYGH